MARDSEQTRPIIIIHRTKAKSATGVDRLPRYHCRSECWARVVAVDEGVGVESETDRWVGAVVMVCEFRFSRWNRSWLSWSLRVTRHGGASVPVGEWVTDEALTKTPMTSLGQRRRGHIIIIALPRRVESVSDYDSSWLIFYATRPCVENFITKHMPIRMSLRRRPFYNNNTSSDII